MDILTEEVVWCCWHNDLYLGEVDKWGFDGSSLSEKNAQRKILCMLYTVGGKWYVMPYDY